MNEEFEKALENTHTEEEKKEILREEIDFEQLDEVAGGKKSKKGNGDCEKGVFFSCGKNYYCLIPWHRR